MKKLLCMALVLSVSACAASVPDSPAPSVYERAVANERRPDADRLRDASRKPAAVLEFLGIQPGMKVLDMYSGGGYYTEIMDYVVGDGGQVVAHSNRAYLNFVGDEFEKRYLGGRLGHTDVLMAENNELSLQPGAFDAIILILSFHDLYYVAPDSGWPAIDVDRFLAELHRGLADGGLIGVVDHYAAPGAPRETGNTLHRIDPAIVIEEMRAAGFVLDGQSDILRTPHDDYTKPVFDPALRGHTDRFLLRFRKAR